MTPNEIASRALFLAYEASQVVGMGVLQAREGATEEQVWSSALAGQPLNRANENDGYVYADYIFGRMMKLKLVWEGGKFNTLAVLHPDYQSWCREYPTLTHLINAASNT